MSELVDTRKVKIFVNLGIWLYPLHLFSVVLEEDEESEYLEQALLAKVVPKLKWFPKISVFITTVVPCQCQEHLLLSWMELFGNFLDLYQYSLNEMNLEHSCLDELLRVISSVLKFNCRQHCLDLISSIVLYERLIVHWLRRFTFFNYWILSWSALLAILTLLDKIVFHCHIRRLLN